LSLAPRMLSPAHFLFLAQKQNPPSNRFLSLLPPSGQYLLSAPTDFFPVLDRCFILFAFFFSCFPTNSFVLSIVIPSKTPPFARCYSSTMFGLFRASLPTSPTALSIAGRLRFPRIFCQISCGSSCFSLSDAVQIQISTSPFFPCGCFHFCLGARPFFIVFQFFAVCSIPTAMTSSFLGPGPNHLRSDF